MSDFRRAMLDIADRGSWSSLASFLRFAVSPLPVVGPIAVGVSASIIAVVNNDCDPSATLESLIRQEMAICPYVATIRDAIPQSRPYVELLEEYCALARSFLDVVRGEDMADDGLFDYRSRSARLPTVAQMATALLDAATVTAEVRADLRDPIIITAADELDRAKVQTQRSVVIVAMYALNLVRLEELTRYLTAIAENPTPAPWNLATTTAIINDPTIAYGGGRDDVPAPEAPSSGIGAGTIAAAAAVVVGVIAAVRS